MESVKAEECHPLVNDFPFLLFLIGNRGDQALWHIWQVAPNNGWSNWASLGGWIDQIAVESRFSR
ncbi:hypothetical protein C4A75_02275 [Brevibacillus laterosporus]|nr:hypothetical protein C4A75_02275 [Brevibacillus laterosporus]